MDIRQIKQCLAVLPDLSQRRVLIIDSDVMFCVQLAECLSRLGFDCFWEVGIHFYRLRRFESMNVIIINTDIIETIGLELFRTVVMPACRSASQVLISEADRPFETNFKELILLGQFVKPVDAEHIAACIFCKSAPQCS